MLTLHRQQDESRFDVGKAESPVKMNTRAHQEDEVINVNAITPPSDATEGRLKGIFRNMNRDNREQAKTCASPGTKSPALQTACEGENETQKLHCLLNSQLDIRILIVFHSPRGLTHVPRLVQNIS